MTENDQIVLTELLRKVVAAELEARSRVDIEAHAQHHQWIATQIKASERRAAFYTSLAERSLPVIVGMLLIAALGGAAHWLTSHWKP